MATGLASELNAFNQFVQQCMNGSNLSLEESLQRFRQHQRELVNLRHKLNLAEEQSARGESRPLDIDETTSKVRERLAREGITD